MIKYTCLQSVKVGPSHYISNTVRLHTAEQSLSLLFILSFFDHVTFEHQKKAHSNHQEASSFLVCSTKQLPFLLNFN